MKGYLGFDRTMAGGSTSEGNGSPRSSSVPSSADGGLAIPWGLSRWMRFAMLAALLVWVSAPALAGRPLPENILFGSVWIAGRPVADTNLVIEARRGDAGPVVARFHVGEDPGAGELFFLRIHREASPAMSPVAVDKDDVLTLVVISAGRPTHRTHVRIPPPGRSLRIDFGRPDRDMSVTTIELVPFPVTECSRRFAAVAVAGVAMGLADPAWLVV